MAPDGDGSERGDAWFEGDRLLTLFGIGLVLLIIGALALIGSLIVGGGPDRLDPPEAEWTLERINQTHVRIVHAGGEPVPTEHLVVTTDGRARHPSWSAATLTSGDGGTVRASTQRRFLRLHWVVEPDRALLRTWTLDESA